MDRVVLLLLIAVSISSQVVAWIYLDKEGALLFSFSEISLFLVFIDIIFQKKSELVQKKINLPKSFYIVPLLILLLLASLAKIENQVVALVDSSGLQNTLLWACCFLFTLFFLRCVRWIR